MASDAVVSSLPTRRTGRASASANPASTSPSRNASTRSSSLDRSPPATDSSRRSPRRRRRNANGSAPPNGDDNSISAVSASSDHGSAATFSTVNNGRTAGCCARGSSSTTVATGTPAVAKARCSNGSDCVADRMSTAISDHGTPSSRWARRNWSATHAASAVAVGSNRTRTVPAVAFGAGDTNRCADVPGRVPAMRATVSYTAGASRCERSRTTVCVPSGSASASNRGSAPRNENTAWSGSPASTASDAVAASNRTKRYCRGSRC